MSNAKSQFVQLGAQYKEIESILSGPDDRFMRQQEKVSKWSVAHHLHHIGMANLIFWKMIDRLVEDKDPTIVREGSHGLRATVIFTTGIIPRGKGQAPDFLVPPTEITKENTGGVIQASKRGMTSLAVLSSRIESAPGRLPHPVLGPFSAQDWLKFARIHTEHHLKIAREISS